jgi:predicted transposase YdaD
MSRLEKIPVYLSKRIFEKLFKIAEVSNLSKEEYMNYERSLMAKWDEYARNESAIEEGLKKGMKEGRIEGRKEGQYEKGVEVVKNLFATGENSIAKIASIAGVTEEFVRKVKESLN